MNPKIEELEKFLTNAIGTDCCEEIGSKLTYANELLGEKMTTEERKKLGELIQNLECIHGLCTAPRKPEYPPFECECF